MKLPVLDTGAKWVLAATLAGILAVFLLGTMWPGFILAIGQSDLLPFLLLYPALLVIISILSAAFLQTGSTRILWLVASFGLFFWLRYSNIPAGASLNYLDWYQFISGVSILLLVWLSFVLTERRVHIFSRGKYFVAAVVATVAAGLLASVVLQILIPLLPPFADAAGIHSDAHRIASFFALLLSGAFAWHMFSRYSQRRSSATLGLCSSFLLFTAALITRFLSFKVGDVWTEFGRFFILLFIIASAISFLSVYFEGAATEVYLPHKKRRTIVRRRRLKRA